MITKYKKTKREKFNKILTLVNLLKAVSSYPTSSASCVVIQYYSHREDTLIYPSQ